MSTSQNGLTFDEKSKNLLQKHYLFWNCRYSGGKKCDLKFWLYEFNTMSTKYKQIYINLLISNQDLYGFNGNDIMKLITEYSYNYGHLYDTIKFCIEVNNKNILEEMFLYALLHYAKHIEFQRFLRCIDWGSLQREAKENGCHEIFKLLKHEELLREIL
jgi:hypothetical protein